MALCVVDRIGLDNSGMKVTPFKRANFKASLGLDLAVLDDFAPLDYF